MLKFESFFQKFMLFSMISTVHCKQERVQSSIWQSDISPNGVYSARITLAAQACLSCQR